MGLFGTDGVRGKAGAKVSAVSAMRLAMATGIYFRPHAKTNKILVGKDTRRSGYMIENAIVSGLTAVGYDVVQIGPMPTPAIAFLTENMRCDAGIMISASHNPYYDNGIKFFDAVGNKLGKNCESKIEKIYNDQDLIDGSQMTDGEIGKSKRIDDVIGRYIVHIKNSFPKTLSLVGKKIVVDCANGAGYKIAPTVLEELGANVIALGCSPDGFNINEECGAMHPDVLADAVLKHRADIGIALDGDADRVVIIDETGAQVDGDKLMAALSVYLKERGELEGNGMVATVMSNMGLDEYLSKHDIKVLRSAVGDKNVVAMMQENGYNFGGEQSGHVIFHDYAKTGDGIASALQALAYLVQSGKKASEVFDPYESFPQILINLEISKKIPIDEIAGIDKLKSDIEELDMRHLFRYSGTENLIRILLEGKEKQELETMATRAKEFFESNLS